MTEVLAAARTQSEVLGAVLQPALEALGAVAGTVLLVTGEGDRLEIAAARGHEEGARTLWQDGPLEAQGPAEDALERREPLFFEQEGASCGPIPKWKPGQAGWPPALPPCCRCSSTSNLWA